MSTVDQSVMFSNVFFSLLLLITVSVQERSVEDARHVGCYSDTFDNSGVYRTNIKPITLEICLHLCTNMLTRYAGVQASKYLCFCGNDLEQHSKVVEDRQACTSCHEDPSRECGGTTTISLYQLSEVVQEAVLLAMDDGVKILNINTLVMTTIAGSMSAAAVDYHYSLQEIFFISKSKILRFSYIPLLIKYSHPSMVVEAVHNLNDLAVDWIADDLFWSCEESRNITQANLDGSRSRNRLFNAAKLKEVTFDPYEKLIFSLYNYEVTMINSERKLTRHIFGKYSFEYICSVALDLHRQAVYVIGSFTNDGDNHLASTDYNLTSFRVIHSGPELSHPFGLDVLNDVVIWGNYNNSIYTLYRANISPCKRMENITVIIQWSQKINKIKIYHSEAQTPSTKFACMRKTCSHACTAVSLTRVKCECPRDMLLAADGKTCIDEPTTQSSTKKNQETPDEGSTITEYGTATSEGLLSLEVSSSSANPSSEDTTFFREELEEKFEYTQAVMATESQNRESSQKLSLVSTVSIICDLFGISVVLILMYLIFRLHKQIIHYKHKFNQPSELVELTCNDS